MPTDQRLAAIAAQHLEDAVVLFGELRLTTPPPLPRVPTCLGMGRVMTDPSTAAGRPSTRHSSTTSAPSPTP